MIETGLYQHFKGNIYRVIATATHTETNESMVVYHAVDNPDKIWVRPESMFAETVNGVPRFKHIGDMVNNLTEIQDIIRCKDCKLYIQPEQGKVYGRCTYPRDSTPRMQTDFCSYAKRR